MMRFHLSLPVTDIDATVAFYRVLLGAEPVKTKIDYAKFLPPDIALNISFHKTPAGAAARPAPHVGLELSDPAALDRAYDRLSEAGWITAPRETGVCCYANQDKFWVTDPNGYEWELYYLLEDTEYRIASGNTCCPSSADSLSSTCC